MSCYSAVYGVYGIAYSLGMMASTGVTSALASRLQFLEILLFLSIGLMLCVPFLLRKGSSLPDVSVVAPAAQK